MSAPKFEEGEAMIERGFKMLAEKSEALVGIYVLFDMKTGRRHIGGCGLDPAQMPDFLVAAADDVRDRTPSNTIDYHNGEGKPS